MGVKTKKFFNLIWAVFGKLFSGLKLALLGIIIARYLGPKDFGLFSYVISLVSLFSVLAEFRLQNILIRDFAENQQDKNALLGSALKICLFFASIGYIVLALVTFSIGDESLVRFFILIFGTSYFFQVFRFLRAFFIGKELNKLIVRAELITAFIILLIAVALTTLNTSVFHFLLLRIFDVALLSAILVILYVSTTESVFNWKDNTEIRKRLVKDSFP